MATSWRGIRAAYSLRNACPQNVDGVILGNEDCLFLNVYTPFLIFQKPVVRKTIIIIIEIILTGKYYPKICTSLRFQKPNSNSIKQQPDIKYLKSIKGL